MVASMKKKMFLLSEISKYETLDDISEKVKKKERNNFRRIETGEDLIQKKRDEKKWKQSLGYFLLHPEKFSFGLRDIK